MASGEPRSFGALLLRHRLAAGLTQEQLATRASVSPDAIAALERGRRRAPRGATVALLADALGLDESARGELLVAARGAAATRASEPSPAALGEEQSTSTDQRRPPWRHAGQPTPLVGRAYELDLIVGLLRDDGVRLLTLTGPAGVGKTRLALAAAAQLAEAVSLADGSRRFADGVTLVDLTPIRDAALVPGAIGRALGLLDVDSRPPLERLVDSLSERQRMLVVLDNFEQVLPAAGLLADLLAASSHLALLVTSRVPLQLRWEQTLRIAPLPVPDLRESLPSTDALLAVPAVELFVSRARARRADFVLTERHAPLVARLAVQLDGLPLALELAAARLDALSLPTLTRRLGGRLGLLTVEAPDLPERQRSLETAVGWSYDLLSDFEQQLFRCLGVFVGRVTLDAIAAVVSLVDVARQDGVRAAGPDAREGAARDGARMLRGLISLVEKSLVLPSSPRPEAPGTTSGQSGWQGQPGHAVFRFEEGAEEDDDPEPSFGMLETVREYAEERLTAEGELAVARRAHAYYFVALAERAAPELVGRDQRAWYLRLEREQDNLRAALRWLLDRDDRHGPDKAAEWEAGLRLVGALGTFWLRRGYYAEGGHWLEEALARPPEGAERDPAVRARTLVAAGPVLAVQGAVARARAVLEEGLALAERHRDATTTANAQTFLGLCAVLSGQVEEGNRLLHEALRRWEALDNPQRPGETLFYLGLAADTTGDAEAAAACYADALRRLEVAGDAQLAGFVHCYLGVTEWRRGELPSAVEHIRATLRISVALWDRWLLSYAVRPAVALVGARGDAAARVRLLGAADALAQGTGATLAWEQLPETQNVVGLHAQIEREGDWGAAYQEGRSLPFNDVAALALTLLGNVAQALIEQEAAPGSTQSPPRPSQPSDRSPRSPQSPLTAREREILRLVAQGLSSKAIGRQLFLAPSTVNYHLTAVFNKLGVDTRAQAVAVASQHGLL